MKNILIMILCVAFIVSCSTQKGATGLKKSDEDLVDSFKLEDFEDFKVTDEVQKTPVPTKTPETSVVSEKKKITQVVPTPTPTPTPKPVTLSERKPDLEKTKTKWPEGYPEQLIKVSEDAKTTWNAFHYLDNYENETKVFVIKFWGITMGHLTIENRGTKIIKGKKVYNLYGNLKSASYFSFIYELDDYIETYVDADTFVPLRYSVIQRESRQNVDDLQLFDHEKLKTFTWYKKVKKNRNKDEKKQSFVPKLFQDPYSTISFVRGLEMSPGKEYAFPVVNRTKIWIFQLKVEGIETVELDDGNVKAWHLSAKMRKLNSKKVDKDGKPFWYSGDAWYADDATRRLVKFKASTKIGAVEGKIINYSKK